MGKRHRSKFKDESSRDKGKKLTFEDRNDDCDFKRDLSQNNFDLLLYVEIVVFFYNLVQNGGECLKVGQNE